MRFVVGVGVGEPIGVGQLEHALMKNGSFAVDDFTTFEVPASETKQATTHAERSRARAAKAAFHWRLHASLYVGISSNIDKDKQYLYLSTINEDGEEGQTIIWHDSFKLPPAPTLDGAASTQVTCTIVRSAALWLGCIKPPRRTVIPQYLTWPSS